MGNSKPDGHSSDSFTHPLGFHCLYTVCQALVNHWEMSMKRAYEDFVGGGNRLAVDNRTLLYFFPFLYSWIILYKYSN
jgi:hypothetical protein